MADYWLWSESAKPTGQRPHFADQPNG